MVLVDKGAGIYRRPPTPVPTETDVCMEAGGRDRNFPLGTISTLNWFVPQPQAPGAQSHPSIRLDHMVKSQGTVTTGSHQKPRAGPNTPGPKLENNSAEHPTTRPAWVGKLCGPPTKVLDTWDTEDTPSWEHCVAEISLEFTSQSLTGADGLSQSCRERSPVLRDHKIWWSLYTGFTVTTINYASHYPHYPVSLEQVVNTDMCNKHKPILPGQPRACC